MKEQMVTVVDVNGQTIGSYPVVLGGLQATRERYEEEALKCAREDGVPEER